MSSQKILAVAREEFLTTVSRKSFILAIVGLPALLAVSLGLSVLVSRNRLKEQSVGMVDPAHVVDLSRLQKPPDAGGGEELKAMREGGRVTFVPFETKERALEALSSGQVQAFYDVDPAYPKSNQVTVYTRKRGLMLDLALPGEGTFISLMRGSLAHRQSLPEDVTNLVVSPAQLKEVQLNREGKLKPIESEAQKLMGLLVPLGVFVLFGLCIFLTSNYLLQGTAEEKENRVIEAILSSVSPIELLAGKLIGLGGAGSLQVLLYAALALAPAAFLGQASEVTPGQIALCLVFFALGLMMFSSLMAAVGMVANSVREGTQMSAIWTVIAMLPLMLFQVIAEHPDAPLAKALSYFPLTAPNAMLIRLTVSNVPPLEIALSALALVAGTALSIWGGAKVFRTAALITGQTISFQQVLRWLRQS